MATVTMKMDIGGLHRGSWNQWSLYFLTDDGGTSSGYTIAKDLVADWDVDHKTDLLGLFPVTYAFEWVKAYRIRPTGSHSFWKEYPGSAGQGTGGAASANLSIAPIIKLFPAISVNTQGRIFLPAVAEDDLADNVYEAGYVTNVLTTFGNMLSWTGSESSRSYLMAINSPKLNGAFAVSSVLLSSMIGNLKKRRVPR